MSIESSVKVETESIELVRRRCSNYRISCPINGISTVVHGAFTNISSQNFSFENSSWHVSMFPQGHSELYTGKCGIHLHIESDRNIHTEFHFKLKNQNGSHPDVETMSLHYAFTRHGKSWGLHHVISSADLTDPTKGFVVNDTAIVEVYIKVFADADENNVDWWSDIPNERLNSTGWDVTLKVGEVKITAHKFILSLHSEVFRAMFSNTMQESITNEIVISDFSEEVVQSMLLCLYDFMAVNGEMKSFGKELLQIASKYQITKLIAVAEIHLASTLTVDNVIDMLHFADLHSSKVLKNACFNTILRQYETILARGNLTEELGISLCNELFTHMAMSANVTVK